MGGTAGEYVAEYSFNTTVPVPTCVNAEEHIVRVLNVFFAGGRVDQNANGSISGDVVAPGTIGVNGVFDC